MNLGFIMGDERKNILEELKEKYGIEKIPEKLVRSGKERIRAFTGSLSLKEINELSEAIPIEGIGLYCFSQQTGETRLTIDATTLFREQIKKGIFEINQEQYEEWMHGNDIFFDKPISEKERGFKIIKFHDDFLGCGKISENKISNFIPKPRRLRN